MPFTVRLGSSSPVRLPDPLPRPLFLNRGCAMRINMRTAIRSFSISLSVSFALFFLSDTLLAGVQRATLSGGTLLRALLEASSSRSHQSRSNTCHCQSLGGNTLKIPSFGLIKSPGLFELQSLQQIIAASRC